MRFDAYKVCRGRRRPLAKRTGGIGVWEHLLHIVAVIAVLTNCWLIAFTNSGFNHAIKHLANYFATGENPTSANEPTEEIGTTATIFIVVVWEHIMLLIKYLMGTSISTLPKEIRDEIKQKQYLIEQERYANMRLKTEQTRRSKRDKSLPGGFRVQSDTPESAPCSGNIAYCETENKDDSIPGFYAKSPDNNGRLRTIESSEESLDERPIGDNRPGELYEC